MAWKYVIIENRLAAYPIIFPDKLVHLEVATVMNLVVPKIGRHHPRPVSAGMIEHVEVHGLGGESKTLKMNSRPGDISIIHGYSYFHGIKP